MNNAAGVPAAAPEAVAAPVAAPAAPTAAAAARAAKKALEAKVTAAYKIVMKQKNVGYDAFVAAIEGLTPEQLATAQHTTGTTFLEKAIAMHALRITTLLLDRGVPVKPKQRGSEPPLNIAVEKADLPIIKLLLERGADPNAQRTQYSETPLLMAARNQKKTGPAIVEALIAAGADLNKTVHDLTPLRRAIQTGNAKIYHLLLSKGATLNPVDITYLGIEPGSLEILKDLVARGIDVNTLNTQPDEGYYSRSGTVLHSVLHGAAQLANNKFKQPLVMPILEHLAASGIDWRLARPSDGMAPLQHYLLSITGRYGWTTVDGADITYIDSIATYLLSKGADINAKNTKGATALYTAITSTDAKLTRKLLGWGADVNQDLNGWTVISHAITMKKFITAATKREMIDVICSAPGIDVNREVNGSFPLMETASQNDLETMARLLATPGIQVDKKTEKTGAALHQVKSREAVKLLIDAGANVNLLTPPHPAPPLYYAAWFGRANVIEALVKVPGINIDIKIAGLTVLERAEKNKFTKVPEINAFLVKLLTPPETLWEGWTRNDLDKFDIIFGDDTADEYSCCPVCLKYVERREGCMYIREHNCTGHGKDYYHKDLYQKYKSPDGRIYWCTICGRISLGHSHYELGPAAGPLPQLIRGTGGAFDKDCKAQGGGSRIEKVARFRRLREYALELQDDVGKKTFTTAMNELVEEMWNAPMARKGVLPRIMAEKKWNIPAEAFPAPPPPVAEPDIDFASFPNLTRPAAEAALVPTTQQGEDSVTLEPDIEVIQFHHVQPDGTTNHHTVTCISADSLERTIRDAVGAFSMPKFGLCWESGGCKARLWPEEIKPFVPDELYNEYRMKFNWKFRGGATGGRRTRKERRNRKTRRNIHRGGHQQNIFVPATNAQCYLPTNRRTNKKNNRSNNRNNRNSSNSHK